MKIETLKAILEEVYGITSEAELDEAIRKMEKPDIGLFTMAVAPARLEAV